MPQKAGFCCHQSGLDTGGIRGGVQVCWPQITPQRGESVPNLVRTFSIDKSTHASQEAHGLRIRILLALQRADGEQGIRRVGNSAHQKSCVYHM